MHVQPIHAVRPLQPLNPPAGQPGRKAPPDPAAIEAAARKVVANSFFGTMLKQVRESSSHDKLFSGGEAGKTFRAMLDDHLADRMSDAPAGRKLARVITSRLTKHLNDVTNEESPEP